MRANGRIFRADGFVDHVFVFMMRALSMSTCRVLLPMTMMVVVLLIGSDYSSGSGEDAANDDASNGDDCDGR